VAVTDVPVTALDLLGRPEVDAGLFPDGVNVEFVNLLPAERVDVHIRMRVHERGVGETRSCGTGACAAAYAALVAGGRTEGTVAVDVPGGRLSVSVGADTTVLTGPAVLVTSGRLSSEWLAG
jgi:diaminopimelate epimerase